MVIIPNRNALKDIADFNIDASFVQRYGNQIFSFSGEATDDYKNLCQNLSTVINDSIEDLQSLSKEIPVFK